LTGRREVRVSEDFFRQLDAQLGPTRGVHGEPSSTDYLTIELPAVVERFATDFDSLAEFVDGVPTARMLVTTGVLVRASVVYGLEVSDGGIELIGIMLDLG
jgi:hypothetical protein